MAVALTQRTRTCHIPTFCKTWWCNHDTHALILQRKMAWAVAPFCDVNQRRRSPWLLVLPPCVGLTKIPPPSSLWGNLFLQESVVNTWLIRKKIDDKLREHVISISANNFHIFHGAEVEEVRRTVYFVIELLWIGQLQFITHIGGVANTCKTRKSGC